MNFKFHDFTFDFSENNHLDKLNADLIDKDTTNEIYKFHSYVKGACLLMLSAGVVGIGLIVATKE